MIIEVPVGNDVVLPQQYPVEGLAGGDLFVTALGREQLIEQMIDHRIGDARVVLAALDPDLAGVKILPLLEARAEGLVEGHQDHVEIELVEALFVLGAIDRAQPGVDADAGEVLDVGLEDALQIWIDQQDLQAQRLPGRILQALAIELPAGLGQQGQGLAHGFPGDAPALGLRQAERLGEQPGRQLLAIRFEQQPFMADRQPAGGELAVGVVAHGAFVGAAEQGAVGPLEVEHQAQCFANPGLGECRAAAVDEQALGLGRDLVRDLRLDHLASTDRRKTVAGGPVFRLVLDVDVELAGLERFERDVAVTVELDFHAIDVVLAAVDRQVLAPVVLDPLEHDLAPRVD
ncbi:hypothetical protein D3C76_798550 [compost metagenome]